MGYVLAPVIAFVAVIGLMLLVMRAQVLPADRRRRAARGRFDLPLTSGLCARAVPVPLAGPWESIPSVVSGGLHSVGIVSPRCPRAGR